MKKMVVLFVGALALFAVQAEPAAKTNGDSPSAAAKTVLESRIAEQHKILVSDRWGGGHRIIFDFNGRKGWIIEPETAAAGKPWVWTMQWMGAFLDRTGAPQLVEKGWHHVHLEAHDTRADDKGLEVFAAFQNYLVTELGFAAKANLIGMSWGGFYSVRYASAYPQNVARIYLDAPLLNVYTLSGLDPNKTEAAEKSIGSWGKNWPKDTAADPRMAVNRGESIAKAGIPVLLVYGRADLTVPPKENSERFIDAFKKAGGQIDVVARGLWGHHPHGLDAKETDRIVSFFCR